jgi:hypothetical protein
MKSLQFSTKQENWKYLSRTNSDHYWSSLFEIVGARERRIYWDQEEDPKQEKKR